MKEVRQDWLKSLTARLMDIVAIGGVVLLMLFFLAVGVRSFAQFVLVDTMGLSKDHAIVAMLYKERKKNAIAEDDRSTDTSARGVERVFERYLDEARIGKTKVERTFNDYSLGQNFFTRLVNRVEYALGYNLSAFEDGSVFLDEDYCYVLEREQSDAEIKAQADEVIAFADAIAIHNIPFVYVRVPNKVCIEQDWFSGTIDFTEQNRLKETAFLRGQGIDVLDLTEVLHAEGLTHKELFFPTDHHWTPATALWAAEHIASYTQEQYGLNLDRSVLDSTKYDCVVYEDVFLGSSGQKVTEEKIAPDDFYLYYPKFETDIDLYLQRSVGEEPRINTRGDFSIQYDMYYLEIFTPILEGDIYSTYLYADPCMVQIKNHMNPDGPRVLLIGDSFDNVLIPFLAQAAGETVALDCRFASAEELHGELLLEGFDLIISTTCSLERLLPE